MCNGVGAANSANQTPAIPTKQANAGTGTGTAASVANTSALATAGSPSLFGSSGVPNISGSGVDSFTPSSSLTGTQAAGTANQPNIMQVLQSVLAFLTQGKQTA